MQTNFEKSIKLFFFLGILLSALNGHAQINIIQNTIYKLESYKNLSFEYVYKQKEEFGDTLINKQKFILLKKIEDKDIGYFFRHEFKYNGMKVPTIELYSGKNQTSLSSSDSTYQTSNKQAMTFNQSLPGQLTWIKTFLNKNPSKLVKSLDTIVNTLNSYHLIIKVKDTLINKDRVYVYKHLFVDKATGLPVKILNRVRTADFSKEVANYYTEENYFNYQVEQDTINAAYFAVPAGFHPFKEKPIEQTALLAPGTTAPEWTLYDTDDKKTSLSEFKGKIVLMDFFFVGCIPCIQSLTSLDNLQKKYKNKNFVLLSLSTRDSKKLVKEFKESQHIKNKMYPNGADVANAYRAFSAPTFYLIDKEGKIVSIIESYSDGFEKKISGQIDALIEN
jgi:peroxiredoxin